MILYLVTPQNPWEKMAQDRRWKYVNNFDRLLSNLEAGASCRGEHVKGLADINGRTHTNIEVHRTR